MSFQVSSPIEGNWETFQISKNHLGNQKETASLKALANKVLQGNRKGNFQETMVSIEGNSKGPVSLPGNSVSKADMDSMKAEYSALSLWLDEIHLKYAIDYSIDIEHCYPSAHRVIQSAIDTMDTHMRAGNLQGFRQAMMRLKSSYLETIRIVNPC